MNDNQYILKWREHVFKAAEALKNRDYETYEHEVEEMESAYEELKRDEALSYEGETTFGAANEIFESVLPDLFNDNREVVKEFIQTIREDKNLQAQFLFFESLKQYKDDYDLNKYLQEAVNLALEKINPSTIKESNLKLYNILHKYNVKPNDFLNEENLTFYKLCDTIFSSQKSLTNLGKLNETFNKVSDYVKSHTSPTITENINKVKSIKEFAEKYNKTLTEDEKRFLNIILDSKNEKERKDLYESYRQACLDKINHLINESSDTTTKNRLNNLIENVSAKEYNKSTILEDIVKILEISDVLNE